jgi:uncharacterized membrane protein
MFIKVFLVALPIFLLIDMIWLGVIAKNFYNSQIGTLMKFPVNWTAAIIFYAIFVLGLVFFVIYPGIEAESIKNVYLKGAFFGLVTYATYDLTNLATLKGWPLKLVLVDVLWGTVLGSLVSVITFFIVNI